MMYRLSIIIFICVTYTSQAQIIRLRELNKPEDIRSGSVSEIREQYILGSVVIKHYKKFNEQNRVLFHERYNVYDSLQARFVFTYDASGIQKTSGIYLTKTGFESLQYVEEIYQYDSGGLLVCVVRMNRMKDTLSILEVISNAQHEIIQVNEYSNSRKLIWSDPPLNGTIKKDDKVEPYQAISVFPYREESKSGWKYNEHNDLIKTSHAINKWQYDDRGNWIRVRVFNVDRGSKTLSLDKQRTILYR